MDIPLLLNPDNIFFDIYNLLWTNKYKQPSFSFLIPDTVLFIEDKPVLWLFNSKSGSIKRKLKDKLNIQNIINKFSKKKAELIGYYFYHKEKDITLIENLEQKEQDNNYFLNLFVKEMDVELPIEKNHEVNSKNLKFEFFENQRSLKVFLETFKKRMGVLQLFINSNQDPNTMFRILWTPKSKIFDMRRSRKPLHRIVHFYEKCVTYETEKFNIKTEQIKSSLVQEKLEKATLEIVEQLENLYKDTFKIKSIILHFKESKKEELFFTYCTGIYLVQYESHEKNNSIWKGLFFESDISEKFFYDISKHEYEKNYDLTPDYKCVNCNKLISHKQAKSIEYKCLIKSERMRRIEKNSIEPSSKKEEIVNFFQKKYNKPLLIHNFDEKEFNERQENTGNSFFPLKVTVLKKGNNSEIPHAIRNVQIKLTKDKYDILKNGIFFKERKVMVCEECYIELTRIYYFTKDEYNTSVVSLKIKNKVNLEREKIKEFKELESKSKAISIKQAKDSIFFKIPLKKSTSNIRLQSAVFSGIQTNKTRNVSTTIESKNYLSFNSLKRSFSGKSFNKLPNTNYSSMILRDESNNMNTKTFTRPKIFPDKRNVIEIRKDRNFSLFTKKIK